MLIPPDLAQANRAFSSRKPGLQIAVDSTSLGAFKRCPRYYYYSIVRGLRPKVENVHLVFGLLMHSGRECYDRERAKGASHQEAIRRAIALILRATWNSELNRSGFIGDQYKNRSTLLRTLVWYLDQFESDPLETIQLANGQPAVELSFRFDSGLVTGSGESWLLCGHLDRLVLFNGVPYVCDLKTTKSELNDWFFRQFAPHNQFSLYLLAGQIVWHVPVQGLIVDGARVLVNSSEYRRKLVQRDEPQLAEWYADTGRWLRRMEECAEEAEWPMNETACGHYATADGRGGCEYRETCSRSPRGRETWLASEFGTRIWDPTQVRGDI